MAKRGRNSRAFGNHHKPISGLFVNLIEASLFKGTMMFPLAGAETEEHFDATTVFTGDFAVASQRAQIFNKPRRYSFSIVLIPTNGKYEDIDIGEYDLPELGGVEQGELVGLIKSFTHEQLASAPAESYDLAKSVAIIQLYHTKAELDYTAIIAKRLQVAETAKTYIVEDVA